MAIGDVLMFIVYLIAGLLLLTVLVVAHEAGHFFVGKKCGIGIVEFSAGMGPKIFSKVKNGIRYSVRALPIGGFVQFVGEDENDPDPKAFNNRPAWQRFLTLLAGPFMNVVVAVVLTLVVLLGFGDAAPYIVEVEPDTPAYEAGLKPGDRMAEINGVKIDFSSELALASNEDLFSRNEDHIELVVERDGELAEYTVPFEQKEDGTKAIGISYGSQRRNFGFFEAIGLSFKWMYIMMAEIIKALGAMIFMGAGTENMMGPIGTASYVGQAVVRYGGEVAMRLASMIGVNLAVVNLLPIPGLDGGRILFLGLEKITKNRIPKKAEGIVNFVGLVLLIGLIILLTVQDFSRGLI